MAGAADEMHTRSMNVMTDSVKAKRSKVKRDREAVGIEGGLGGELKSFLG